MKAIQLTLWYLRNQKGQKEASVREVMANMREATHYLNNRVNIEGILSGILEKHGFDREDAVYYTDYDGFPDFNNNKAGRIGFKEFPKAIKDLPVIYRGHYTDNYTHACLSNMVRKAKKPKIARRKDGEGLFIYRLKDDIYQQWTNEIAKF